MTANAFLHRTLPRLWQQRGLVARALWPLSQLYGAAWRWQRRRALDQQRERLPVPVLVVGNVVAGGAGKTPATIAIVQHFQSIGVRIGVISRGYGRNPQAPHCVVITPDTDASIGGDEPVLIHLRTNAPVIVCPDRNHAAREMVKLYPDVRVIVCDDGLQHHALLRDGEICVMDERGIGNGWLLPAGPLREPVERGRCCDFRVVNLGHGAGQGGTGFGEWPMHLQARAALPIAGGRPRALASYIGIRVHAVAGIGNPQRFFDMLRALGVGVVPHAFADHHAYRPEDLQFGNDLPVLMTEKDAVKCAPFADARCFAVPVDAELPAAFWVALLDRLDRLR